METADAITEMDAARKTLKKKAPGALDAIVAVIAGLYPGGKYLAPNSMLIFSADGRRVDGPYRNGQRLYPTHLVFDWPLDRLPKLITRPHLGKHADSKTRTLNSLMRQVRRTGLEIPYGDIGRHYAPRLTLR